jgi:hypothetical protein
MQLPGDIDIHSFVRICCCNWIGHVFTMESKSKVSQVLKNNPQGIDEESGKTDAGTVYKQIL